MSPRDMRPNEVSAGGIVVRRSPDGLQVCLINDGRYWGIPKGNVERGESPEDAARREIHEEVGLPLEGLRIIATLPPSEYVYRRAGRLIFKRVHQFLVESEDGTLRPDGHEVEDAVWLPFDEARRQASFPDTVKALDAASGVLRRGTGATDSAP